MFLRILYCLQVLILIDLVNFSGTVNTSSDLNKARLPTIYNAVIDAHTAMVSLLGTILTELTAEEAHLGDPGCAAVGVCVGKVGHERVAPWMVDMLLLDRLDRGATA